MSSAQCLDKGLGSICQPLGSKSILGNLNTIFHFRLKLLLCIHNMSYYALNFIKFGCQEPILIVPDLNCQWSYRLLDTLCLVTSLLTLRLPTYLDTLTEAITYRQRCSHFVYLSVDGGPNLQRYINSPRHVVTHYVNVNTVFHFHKCKYYDVS